MDYVIGLLTSFKLLFLILLTYLFEEYGWLSPDELFQKEDKVKNFVYDPNQSVSVLFNEILKLKDLFELIGSVLNEFTIICLG